MLFTEKQLGAQAMVAQHIKTKGKITAWEIQTLYHTTDARKLAHRLVKAGVIKRVTREVNANGRGTHAVYHNQ